MIRVEAPDFSPVNKAGESSGFSLGCRLYLDRSRLSSIGKNIAHAANLRANTTQLFLDVLVPAVHVIDAVKYGFAVSHHRCKHQRSRSPEVGAHDRCSRERRFAPNSSRAPIHLDVRAHADQLLHMHEPVLKDILCHDRSPLSLRRQRHVLRLHVGRETRIFLSRNIGSLQIAFTAYANFIFPENFHTRSSRFQLADHRTQVRRIAVGHAQITAGYRPGHQKSTRLNAIGVDAMTRAMQLLNALYANLRRPRALDLRSHRRQQRSQVRDLRLTGAVLHDGLTFGKHRSHQQVLGPGDSDLVEYYVRALQSLRASLDISMFIADHRAHRLQSLDVQINRTPANGAASRHGNPCQTGASHQRPQHQRRSPHGLDDLVLRHRIGEHTAADRSPMLRAAIAQLNFSPHRNQQFALGLNVAHLRNVLEDDLIFSKDGRSHAGKRRVLRAADANGSNKGIAPANHEFIHEILP